VLYTSEMKKKDEGAAVSSGVIVVGIVFLIVAIAFSVSAQEVVRQPVVSVDIASTTLSSTEFLKFTRDHNNAQALLAEQRQTNYLLKRILEKI